MSDIKITVKELKPGEFLNDGEKIIRNIGESSVYIQDGKAQCPDGNGLINVFEEPGDEGTYYFFTKRIEKLEDELETLRMKLAACGVAALANTPESIKLHRITSDNPYYSASYRDVCDTVDREMAFRREVEEFKDFFKDHDIVKDLLWDRMDYEGDDGRATLAFKRLKELLDEHSNSTF